MCKNKLVSILILFVFVAVVLSCNGNSKKVEKSESHMEASLVSVSISGMTCTGCEQTIQKSISSLEGVKSVKASFTTGIALVEYYPSKVDTMKMKECVSKTGYTARKFTEAQPH
jgi:mercuric ion transport protein